MKFLSLHLLQRILYGECEHCRRDLQEIQLHYQPSDCEDVPEMVEEFYEHKRQEETDGGCQGQQEGPSAVDALVEELKAIKVH